jgi:K+-sensing histidine kinase KdpD
MSHAQVPSSRPGRIAAPSAPIAILWAGAAAVVPTLIRLAVDHVVSDVTIFPAYFPFVMAAATFLGWRSAVVAAVLSALAANYMFMGPRFQFSAAAADIAGTLLFLASAGVVIFGVDRLKAAVHAKDLEQAALDPADGAGQPPANGPALALAAALSLGAWAAMIWGAWRAIRQFV